MDKVGHTIDAAAPGHWSTRLSWWRPWQFPQYQADPGFRGHDKHFSWISPHITPILASLTNAIRGGGEGATLVDWSSDTQLATETAKQQLWHTTDLPHPDKKADLSIMVDTSATYLGRVLQQKHQHQKKQGSLDFYSKTLALGQKPNVEASIESSKPLSRVSDISQYMSKRCSFTTQLHNRAMDSKATATPFLHSRIFFRHSAYHRYKQRMEDLLSRPVQPAAATAQMDNSWSYKLMLTSDSVKSALWLLSAVAVPDTLPLPVDNGRSGKAVVSADSGKVSPELLSAATAANTTNINRVAEPKLFFSAPASTFKKFPLRLRSRLRLQLELWGCLFSQRLNEKVDFSWFFWKEYQLLILFYMNYD